jgi:hypothetical protein
MGFTSLNEKNSIKKRKGINKRNIKEEIKDW